MFAHPVAVAVAMARKAVGEDASPASQIRRATAYLDEGRAFKWNRGGSLLAITTERAEDFELPFVVRHGWDTRDLIDKRLAEAHYETATFADYIGAGTSRR
jgi:hypothetical protein